MTQKQMSYICVHIVFQARESQRTHRRVDLSESIETSPARRATRLQPVHASSSAGPSNIQDGHSAASN